ncbi:MAG: molybdopterin-dependent oxidoreductase [Nitrospinota bacterium]
MSDYRVGALPVTPGEETWIPSVCDMCYNACTIRVRRKNGVVTKVEGIPEAGPNYGKICAKGNAAPMNLYNPNRILHPLRRTNPEKGFGVDPGWERISWEEALDTICAKLKEVREEDPRALYGTSFDGHSQPFFHAFMSGFGSPHNAAGAASFYCGNGVHPVSYAVTGSNDVHPDLGHCNYLIQFGTYYGFVAQINAMGIAQEMSDARARGMKMVVVDPMLSYPASQAEEWVPILPGTDAALALGMMYVLIHELEIYDREYLKRYTNLIYLTGPDGRYVRDPASGKPLVWDAEASLPRPYDEPDSMTCSLEGEYEVGGKQARPAFQVFKEHVLQYTPEVVEGITTVPAATTRRLAKEFGENARIGSTITIDGETLPHRPAVATWYRGVSGHKHGMLNGMTLAFLNVLVGTVDVPGGILNAAAAGPCWFPEEGVDGFIRTTNPFTRHMKPVCPPAKVKAPETLELTELFPVAVYAGLMMYLAVLDPEKYGLPYEPKMMIQCRSNVVATAADPELMAEAMRRIPFVLSFSDHHNETSEFADIVLPDAHFLERLSPFAHNPFMQYRHVPEPGEAWTFSYQQPVVEAQGEARHWVRVLWEIAVRMGFQGDVYAAFNAGTKLEEPYRLDPTKTYAWEEVADIWAKARCGQEHGLAYFQEHGYVDLCRRTVRESYPRIFHKGRIPFYLEHFLSAGEDVKQFTESHGIEWDTSDYVPLVRWRPCPAYEQDEPDYDLFVVNHKVAFLTFTFTAENPWLMDIAERNDKIFNVGIHPETARRKGLRDGQRVYLETLSGRRQPALLRVTEGVHPQVISVPGILGRWITRNDRARGKGVHFNSLIKYSFEQIDTVSAALDSCVKVKVFPAD